MSKINFLKPDKSNLYTFLYLGSFLFFISVLDVFLNSFFSAQFANNRKKQIIDFDKFIRTWDKDQNLVFVTHYVVIAESLNYAPSSGEIVISNKNFKVIDTIAIEY